MSFNKFDVNSKGLGILLRGAIFNISSTNTGEKPKIGISKTQLLIEKKKQL